MSDNMLLQIVLLATSVIITNSLDNGLALTPPLGWLTWQRFRCNTDCANDPENCISEKLIMEMADRMAADGYRDAGYEYIIIDDCWPAKERTPEGKLEGDPVRFPHGMKALADYVHSKGLKFGLYEDFGKQTCAGYPGSEFFMESDAKTFAEWGVDFIKFDQCNSAPADIKYGYPIMEFFLNQTRRPMLFACEWPLNTIFVYHKIPDYAAIRKTCNMWRNYNDITDSWDSITDVIRYYTEDNFNMSSYTGPGGWNDPDMLCIGNFGLSPDQERAHMGMWCMFPAPLLMSNDLRHIRNTSRSLLLNKRLLAINQDPLGLPGTFKFFWHSLQVWTRPIMPKGSMAIAVLNKQTGGSPAKASIPLSKYNLQEETYDLYEVFDGKFLGRHNTSSVITFYVNPTGIYMFVAFPVSQHK